jgi:IS30 family transposase
MKKVHLIPEQRHITSAMHKQCCTQKQIVKAIGKDKSVLSRELKRNANSTGKYSFEYAQDMAKLT